MCLFNISAYILLWSYRPLVSCTVLSWNQTGLPKRRFQIVWKRVPPRLRPGCRETSRQNGGGMDPRSFEDMSSLSSVSILCSSCPRRTWCPDRSARFSGPKWEGFFFQKKSWKWKPHAGKIWDIILIYFIYMILYFYSKFVH